jgi:Ca2+-dependent lipid-binding protein
MGPMMYAVVVRSVRVKRIRTYADGKCSEDFHISIAEKEYCDMQLVIEQCVKLHDSNVKLVIAIQ